MIFDDLLPNRNILIFEGKGELEFSSGEKYGIENLSVEFSWQPKYGVVFNFSTSHNLNQLESSIMLNMDRFVSIKTDDFETHQGLIMRTGSSNSIVSARGVIYGRLTKGDDTISVSRIEFAVPNLRFFSGGEAYKLSTGNGFSRGLIKLETSKSHINIWPIKDHKDKIPELDYYGGYGVTYVGEILPKSGQISKVDANARLTKLGDFLSLIAGHKVHPIFIIGMHDGDDIWQDWTNYSNHEFIETRTWADEFNLDGWSQLFGSMINMSLEPNKYKAIKTSIKWYCETNIDFVQFEKTIMMIQANLELIYNYYVVEEMRIIPSYDTSSISASSKLRILSSLIPRLRNRKFEECEKMHLHLASMPSDGDIFDLLVFIRNGIVHGNSVKREAISGIDMDVINESIDFGLYLVEMSLLHILGFSGSFSDRLIKNSYKSPGNNYIFN